METVQEAFLRVHAESMTRHEDGTPVKQSTAPQMMARMLSFLQVETGMNVLEIGTGSGYNAALLRELVGPSGSVTTVEVDTEVSAAAEARLRENGYGDVLCIAGDGWAGYNVCSPYDRIIATAKLPSLPPAWVHQLQEDGILATPLDVNGVPLATVVAYLQKCGEVLESLAVHQGGFISMANSPEAVLNEPWKQADVVVWGEKDAEIPALWLHLPGTPPAPPERMKLVGSLLMGGQAAPLPTHCSIGWDFFLFCAATGQTDNLFICSTTEGFGLSGSGFGYYDENLNIVYVERSSDANGWTFGQPTHLWEQVLETYEEWVRVGQPGPEKLKVTTLKVGDVWATEYCYTASKEGRRSGSSSHRTQT